MNQQPGRRRAIFAQKSKAKATWTEIHDGTGVAVTPDQERLAALLLDGPPKSPRRKLTVKT